MEELQRRGGVRNEYNPTASLSEFLFCRAYDRHQAPNLEKRYSASDYDGVRYQIKGPRLHRRKESRQLSSLRDLGGFDTLATVLLHTEYKVLGAALIPCVVVRKRCMFIQHTNSYESMLTNDIWDDGRVTDATKKLRAVELES